MSHPSEPRVPVVFVPGVLGSKLRDRKTGATTWGNGRSIFWPHDRGYPVAMPLGATHDAAHRLAPSTVVDEMWILGYRRKVYARLADLFTHHGYRVGDLSDARPAGDFFMFAYDWRRPNWISARRLAERLEALRRERGVERLAVHLVAQSNGAHLCRYLTKYGSADLGEAIDGRARPMAIDIQRLVLVGTANGGALRIVRELDRGRCYVPLVGRKWWPETAFAFRSVFQDLPAESGQLFVDERGEPVDADLWDAESWRRYEWSIFSPEAQRRITACDSTGQFGSTDDQLAYLDLQLREGRAFQRALYRDAPDYGVREIHSIQDTSRPTAIRGVVVRDGDRWRTWYTGERFVTRRPHLARLTTGPGDGHATVASQTDLSPQELRILHPEPLAASGGHIEVIQAEATRQRLIEILTAPCPERAADRTDREPVEAR